MSSSVNRLRLLLEVFVGTGAAVTIVAFMEGVTAAAAEELLAPASSAEPPMATGCDAGLLWVRNQPTPIPPPMAIRSKRPITHTQVAKRVVPFSVFLSQALDNWVSLDCKMLIGNFGWRTSYCLSWLLLWQP
jgi:hypothetical protein